MDYKIGQKIHINHLQDCWVDYDGREGMIQRIDDIGQLHGSWGGLALVPGLDDFTVVSEGYTPLWYPDPMQVKWWNSKDGSYHGGIVYGDKLLDGQGNVHLIDTIIQAGIDEDVHWDTIIIELEWVDLDDAILGDLKSF